MKTYPSHQFRVIIALAIMSLLFLSSCQTTSETPPLEKLEAFFEQAEIGDMTISITDEKGGLRLQNIPMGSTIRVHAKYARFRPNGTYIFYLKPSTGGYKNVMIHTGEYGGANELSGTYSSFYIPTLGQMAGKVEIFVYIPGRGVGVVTTTIVYPKQ